MIRLAGLACQVHRGYSDAAIDDILVEINAELAASPAPFAEGSPL